MKPSEEIEQIRTNLEGQFAEEIALVENELFAKKAALPNDLEWLYFCFQAIKIYLDRLAEEEAQVRMEARAACDGAYKTKIAIQNRHISALEQRNQILMDQLVKCDMVKPHQLVITAEEMRGHLDQDDQEKRDFYQKQAEGLKTCKFINCTAETASDIEEAGK